MRESVCEEGVAGRGGFIAALGCQRDSGRMRRWLLLLLHLLTMAGLLSIQSQGAKAALPTAC